MLNINSLQKSFNGQLILNNLALKVQPGEIIGIMGENGAGKTTLLKTIAGLQKPERGTGSIDELELFTSNPEVRKKILYWGHSPDLYGQFTAFENINFFLELRQEKADEVTVTDCLKKFDLNNSKQKSVSAFSAGMVQRLHLCMAELCSWSLGLFDEPLNALDETGVNHLKRLINTYREQNRSILITSHHAKFLQSVSDKILTINKKGLQEN